jgi:hypothetical protein
MAVEGEKDDITGLGQTRAALDLAVNLPEAAKTYHMQPGAGHYGIFNGSRFRQDIVPLMRGFMERSLRPAAMRPAPVVPAPEPHPILLRQGPIIPAVKPPEAASTDAIIWPEPALERAQRHGSRDAIPQRIAL